MNTINNLKHHSLITHLTILIIVSSWAANSVRAVAADRWSYMGTYNSSGVPDYLEPDRKTFTSEFLTSLSEALPEYKKIPEVHPEYIADSADSNIKLLEQADVFATFLHEGAGFRNSFGYFNFTDSNVPTSQEETDSVIVFPNSSFSGSGGGLQVGDTVKLGTFPAGTNIGFFVAANAWNGTETNPNISTRRVFYTLNHLNDESDPDLRAHTVLLNSPGDNQLVLGMEDIHRENYNGNCDHDFNDIIFIVTSNPPEAIDTSEVVNIPSEVDSDGDGISDAVDDYDNDPERAFNNYYPSENGYEALAFEDMWPWTGDYDLNDLVIRYRFRMVTNANGDIVDVIGYFSITAMGAAFHNGFGVELPVSPSDISYAAISILGGTFSDVTPQGIDRSAITIFDDANQHIIPPNGAGFANTIKNTPHVEGDTFTLKVTFEVPVSDATLGAPPFNPFIFHTDHRGLEIHLPDMPPTSLADIELLGTGDDTSDTGTGRYYKTQGNLPWALLIPYDWSQPTEKTEIVMAYPSFIQWVESGGSSFSDWYLTPKAEHIYTP